MLLEGTWKKTSKTYSNYFLKTHKILQCRWEKREAMRDWKGESGVDVDWIFENAQLSVWVVQYRALIICKTGKECTEDVESITAQYHVDASIHSLSLSSLDTKAKKNLHVEVYLAFELYCHLFT